MRRREENHLLTTPLNRHFELREMGKCNQELHKKKKVYYYHAVVLN